MKQVIPNQIQKNAITLDNIDTTCVFGYRSNLTKIRRLLLRECNSGGYPLVEYRVINPLGTILFTKFELATLVNDPSLEVFQFGNILEAVKWLSEE